MAALQKITCSWYIIIGAYNTKGEMGGGGQKFDLFFSLKRSYSTQGLVNGQNQSVCRTGPELLARYLGHVKTFHDCFLK